MNKTELNNFTVKIIFLLSIVFSSCNNKEAEGEFNNSFTVNFDKSIVKLKITAFDGSSEIESSFFEITKFKYFNKTLNDSVEIPYSIKTETIPNHEIKLINCADFQTNQSLQGKIYSSGILKMCIGGYKCELYGTKNSDAITDNELDLFNSNEIYSLLLQPKIKITGQYREILLNAKINYDNSEKRIKSISFRNISKNYNLDLNKKFPVGNYQLSDDGSGVKIELKISPVYQ